MINKILLTILMFGAVCKTASSERIIKLPEGVAERLKEIAQIQDTLPDVDYHFGWATVKGHILDYHPGMVKEMTLIIGQTNLTPIRHCDTVRAEVSPSGDFTFRFPVAHITPVILELSRQDTRGFLYAGPDMETEIYVDLREVNYRNQNNYGKRLSESMLYMTQGPLAQVANDLNRCTILYRAGINEKYFNEWLSMEAYNHFREIIGMMPTKQVEIRLAELDTLKPDEQWSPAMKELALLGWKCMKAISVNTLPGDSLRNASYTSPEAEKNLLDWQRDALKAKVMIYERMMNNPKQLYYPEILDYLEWCETNTLLPDFIANETKAWRLIGELSKFYLLNPEEIAERITNLPPAYRQLVQTYYDIYREEHDRLLARQVVCDTLQGIPDSLVVPSLCERYRGHTLFIHFWGGPKCDFVSNVVLPLQRELANRDIIWINVFTGSSKKEDSLNSEYANWLRYSTSLKGEHFYYNMSNLVSKRDALCKSMGLDTYCSEPFCIVTPDGKITYNNKDIDHSLHHRKDSGYSIIRQKIMWSVLSVATLSESGRAERS